MVLLVTPQELGDFTVYVKTMAVPHTTSLSHYPHDGLVDPQGRIC